KNAQTPRPIRATPTLLEGTHGTDPAVSESTHRTPHPQSFGCRIRAPSAALCSGIADNWKDAHDRDLRFAPCTAGLNHGAGVASASDLQGNFPQTGSCGGLRSRRRTFRYGALPHL